MARPFPTMTEQDKLLARRLHAGGRSIPGLAREFGVGQMTMRRAIDPDRYELAKKPKVKARNIQDWAIHKNSRRDPVFRVSDYLDHPMERLIHEGPTPERRRMMEEGRV